jgi:hypothetical protein
MEIQPQLRHVVRHPAPPSRCSVRMTWGTLVASQPGPCWCASQLGSAPLLFGSRLVSVSRQVSVKQQTRFYSPPVPGSSHHSGCLSGVRQSGRWPNGRSGGFLALPPNVTAAPVCLGGLLGRLNVDRHRLAAKAPGRISSHLLGGLGAGT